MTESGITVSAMAVFFDVHFGDNLISYDFFSDYIFSSEVGGGGREGRGRWSREEGDRGGGLRVADDDGVVHVEVLGEQLVLG